MERSLELRGWRSLEVRGRRVGGSILVGVGIFRCAFVGVLRGVGEGL